MPCLATQLVPDRAGHAWVALSSSPGCLAHLTHTDLKRNDQHARVQVPVSGLRAAVWQMSPGPEACFLRAVNRPG
jgi:hypothetical protein